MEPVVCYDSIAYFGKQRGYRNEKACAIASACYVVNGSLEVYIYIYTCMYMYCM